MCISTPCCIHIQYCNICICSSGIQNSNVLIITNLSRSFSKIPGCSSCCCSNGIMPGVTSIKINWPFCNNPNTIIAGYRSCNISIVWYIPGPGNITWCGIHPAVSRYSKVMCIRNPCCIHIHYCNICICSGRIRDGDILIKTGLRRSFSKIPGCSSCCCSNGIMPGVTSIKINWPFCHYRYTISAGYRSCNISI